VSPLTQGLNYRSACDMLLLLAAKMYSFETLVCDIDDVGFVRMLRVVVESGKLSDVARYLCS